MITEGVGMKPPAQIQVKMTANDLYVLRQEAIKRSAYRGYKAREDAWGRGIKSTVVHPGIGELTREVRPIFAGCLGEYAVQSYVEARFPGRCPMDLRMHRCGDYGIDLQCFGVRMQVKTRQRSEHRNLVRRTNRRGSSMKIASHVFCFCEWTGMAQVYILGWCWRDAVLAKPLVPSVGEWLNAEIPDAELLPMSRLRDELEAWQEARKWH